MSSFPAHSISSRSIALPYEHKASQKSRGDVVSMVAADNCFRCQARWHQRLLAERGAKEGVHRPGSSCRTGSAATHATAQGQALPSKAITLIIDGLTVRPLLRIPSTNTSSLQMRTGICLLSNFCMSTI